MSVTASDLFERPRSAVRHSKAYREALRHAMARADRCDRPIAVWLHDDRRTYFTAYVGHTVKRATLLAVVDSETVL